MEVPVIEKKVRGNLAEFIRIQLIFQIAFLNKEPVSETDLDILILLGIDKEGELSEFCKSVAAYVYEDITEGNWLIKAQAIRNRLAKLKKRGYIVKSKESGSSTKIRLADGLISYPNGTTIFSHKFMYVEPNQS